MELSPYGQSRDVARHGLDYRQSRLPMPDHHHARRLSGQEGGIWLMKTIERYDDPLEEIYATRRELSARYGHDVHRLAEAAREWKRRDEAEGTRYVRLPIVRCTPTVVE